MGDASWIHVLTALRLTRWARWLYRVASSMRAEAVELAARAPAGQESASAEAG